MHRRQAPHDSALRLEAYECSLRFSDHVHRRRPGHRDDRGARMSDLVLLDRRDGIATLTLNRPDKLNALSPELCQELIDALRRVVADEAVRVVIVTGAGRAFC